MKQTMKVFVAVLLSVFTASVVCGYRPFDCSELYKSGRTASGIYSIYPAGDVPVWVHCDMISDGKDEDKGGWTVIQRRMDGSINFYQPWKEYKKGFGTTESEYWLGLENMYHLTRNRKYMLRVDLEDFEGRKGFAQYSSFSVGPEADGYKLQVSGFKDGGAGDSLTGHNNQKFSTFDKDQDASGNNCTKQFVGVYQYKFCYTANPNGVYLRGEDNTHIGIGVVWSTWKNSFSVSMKSFNMKIKHMS
ncbi:microfibril-associated glycoprotein 4-like [Puntigrus tetrazona]|uniref:microfibril-associated glycoprotein 4-like n=1 Tax=Puntigrus tetrazona TaxID=1606681 RepID=UPI001C8A2B37|nr:microfibril-associated glycoprotein 4-like [Puntigrus tetrazona]